MTESITRLRAGTTTDRYGAEVPDWSDPDRLAIGGCAVAPREAGEDHGDGRQAVILGVTIYAPPGADVGPLDRVIVRGDDYEVDGEPGVWVSPFTDVEEGVEIRTRRIEG